MNWNYEREERPSNDQFVGKHRCVIVDVEETTSKSSGLPMIVITVRPSGSSFKVKTYLVQNDKFNQNATTFFDSFPEIPDGDFNFPTWIGAEGAADFGLDDSGYLKVKWFISSDRAANLPPFEGKKPERQTITNIAEEPDSSEDDLPWI